MLRQSFGKLDATCQGLKNCERYGSEGHQHPRTVLVYLTILLSFSKRYGTSTTEAASRCQKLELCGHGTQVNHVVPHGLLIWHSHACKRMLRLHVTREKEGPQNMLQACNFQSHCWWLSHTKNMSIGTRIITYHNRPNCLFPSNRQQKICLEPTINSCLLSFPAVNFSETLQL